MDAKARRFLDRWVIVIRGTENLRTFLNVAYYFCQSTRLYQTRNPNHQQNFECKTFCLHSLGKVSFFSRIVRHFHFCKSSSRYDRCNRNTTLEH